MIILLIFLLSVFSAFSTPNFYFKQLSVEEGLSNPTVTSILRDNQGAIWIGTKSGLNYFDHTEIQNYFFNSSMPNSLPDNEINFVYEDSLLNIWIGTKKGLVRYDRLNNDFIRVSKGEYPINVRTVCSVNGGLLFAGVGVWKYSYKDDSFSKVEYNYSGPEIGAFFSSIYQIDSLTYIIGTTWKGIFKLDLATNSLTTFLNLRDVYVPALFVDDDKNIWISPYSKGVECYNVNEQLLSTYNTANSAMMNNIVLDITKNDNELLFATDGNGIARLNLETRSVKILANNSSNTYSIPLKSINCLYLDKYHNIYAGTIREGLLCLRETDAFTYKNVPVGNKYGLSDKAVSAFYEDSNYLYIGTDGGGMNAFELKTKQFRHYEQNLDKKIYSITPYSDSELLVSIYGEGLFFFHKNTGKLRNCNFVEPHQIKRLLDSGMGVVVKNVGNGKFLIVADCAYIYDTKTSKMLTTKAPNDVAPNFFYSGILKYVYSNDTIAYLHNDNFITKLNFENLTHEVVYSSAEESLIVDVEFDNNDSFWIAADNGIVKYDSKTKSTKEIKTSLFSSADMLFVDGNGKVYIGAKSLLFVYDVRNEHFTILGESDGVSPNNFFPKSYVKLKNGNLLFGGANGLLIVNHDIKFEKYIEPSVDLINIKVDGKNVILNKNLPKELHVPYDFSSLLLQLITDEEDIFKKRIFKVEVVGIDADIQIVDPHLILYNLPSGRYQINVSCSNTDGSFSAPKRVLTVVVAQPWWNTLLFRCLIAFALITMLLYSIKYYSNKKNSEMAWRMKELKEKEYEDKVRLLINMSHELCTPLTLILNQLKHLLRDEDIAAKSNIKADVIKIKNQVKRMKNLIEMVLEVRRFEMGQTSMNLKEHELKQWIEAVLKVYAVEFETKKLTIKTDFDLKAEKWKFDSSKMESILSNLIDNAIKFSPIGGTIAVKTGVSNEGLNITVSDEGSGLDIDDLDNLFVRFYTGKNSKEGSGIGLSYCKALVELMEGNIDGYNNDGVGATFKITIPKINTESTSLLRKRMTINDVINSDNKELELESRDLDFDTKPYSVLVAEDNSELLKVLKDSFSDSFSDIFTTKKAEDAYIIASQRVPDVFVCDIKVLKNSDIIKRLKDNPSTSLISIILLIPHADSDSVKLAVSSGVDFYLSKPFEIDELMAIIKTQLRNKKSLHSHYSQSAIFSASENKEYVNAEEVFVQKLNSIIIENLSNPNLDIDLISSEIGMSRTSLYLKLKAILNISIGDYINKYRLEKAIILLKDPNLSILVISESLGFSNQQYFSTFFKKMTGKTPSKYRKDIKEDQ